LANININSNQSKKPKNVKSINLSNKKVYLNNLPLNNNKKINSNTEENTIILSHLSLKRKEYVIERFEYIFNEFDKKLKEMKVFGTQFSYK
jgi:hypothetical protein